MSRLNWIGTVVLACYCIVSQADETFNKGLAAFDAGHYDNAFAIWEPLALQNQALAQNHIGYLWANGLGVKKDPIKAVLWYQAAAKNNNKQGITNLAYMYEQGDGIDPNIDKALALYRQASQAGDKQAQQRYDALHYKTHCVAKGATTKLFTLLLNCATRSQLRKAIKAAGALPMQEPDDAQALEDAYHSQQILKRTDQLVLLYTRTGRFARAHYHYPAQNNLSSIAWVYRMITHKYGEPQTRHGDTHSPQMTYLWPRSDGIIISVTYHRRTADVTLQYQHPDHYAQASYDFERLTQTQTQLIFQTQTDAF